MLLDGLLFVFSPGTGGGAAVGDHILDGAAAASADRQLSVSDVFPSAAGQIVGFAYIDNYPRAIPHTVLPRLGGRLLPNPRGGVVLEGPSRLVDGHLLLLLSIIPHPIPTRR